MVLFATSAWLLHWGWYGAVFKCLAPICVIKASETLEQNSFPPFVTISIRILYLQTQFSKTASAMVFASLLSITISLTYFVKASVVHKIYFFPLPDTTKNPKRSASTLWFSCVHRGNGKSNTGFVWSLVLLNCHFWHVFKCVCMSWSIPG